MDRIVTSQTFVKSQILCSFLRFVSEMSLEGRDREISELTIVRRSSAARPTTNLRLTALCARTQAVFGSDSGSISLCGVPYFSRLVESHEVASGEMQRRFNWGNIMYPAIIGPMCVRPQGRSLERSQGRRAGAGLRTGGRSARDRDRDRFSNRPGPHRARGKHLRAT